MLIEFTVIRIDGKIALVKANNSAFPSLGEIPLVATTLDIDKFKVPHNSAPTVYGVLTNQLRMDSRRSE